MKKSSKLLLLAATLVPSMGIVATLVFFSFHVLLGEPTGAVGSANGTPPLFMMMLGLQLGAILWIISLTVIYIVNVYRNEHVQRDMRTLWVVMLIVGSFFAMPIYWYLYIWREGQTTQAG